MVHFSLYSISSFARSVVLADDLSKFLILGDSIGEGTVGEGLGCPDFEYARDILADAEDLLLIVDPRGEIEAYHSLRISTEPKLMNCTPQSTQSYPTNSCF